MGFFDDAGHEWDSEEQRDAWVWLGGRLRSLVPSPETVELRASTFAEHADVEVDWSCQEGGPLDECLCNHGSIDRCLCHPTIDETGSAAQNLEGDVLCRRCRIALQRWSC